jgi:hypothetical protein
MATSGNWPAGDLFNDLLDPPDGGVRSLAVDDATDFFKKGLVRGLEKNLVVAYRQRVSGGMPQRSRSTYKHVSTRRCGGLRKF